MMSHAAGIEAVVFDLGNVLVGWDPYLPLSDRMSRDEWQVFAEESGFSELNLMADNGVSIDEIVSIATERTPRHGERIQRYYERFEHSLTGPVPGVAQIVEELQGRYRLLGLTNWSAETFHYAERHAPAVGNLEAIVVSGQERVAKPSGELFQRLLDKHDLDARRTVFIDDSEPNVRSAAELGFNAITFDSAEQLRADLRRLGVL